MGGCWRTTPRDDSCITPPIKDEYVRWTCHLPKMCTCFAAPNPRPALFPQASHESGSDGLHSCYRGQANSNACKVASVETQEWSNEEAQRLQVTNVDKDFIKPLT
jgi:hypothetical protein